MLSALLSETIALTKLDYQMKVSEVVARLKTDRRLKLLMQTESRRPSFTISDTMIIKGSSRRFARCYSSDSHTHSLLAAGAVTLPLEYRCKLKKTSGKLYISNHHVAHFSKVFGLEKKVRARDTLTLPSTPIHTKREKTIVTLVAGTESRNAG